MIDYEYKLFRCVAIINDNDELSYIQEHIINEIEKITDHGIFEIFILIIDELILNKFPSINMVRLLETKYFSTSFGGNKYFILLKQYMQNRDSGILRLLLLGLKLGFKGEYEQVPENITTNLQQILDIKDTNKHKNTIFLNKSDEAKPLSILWIFAPIIMYLCIKIGFDWYYFGNLQIGGK